MAQRNRSLKWKLVWRLLPLQAVLLILSVVTVVGTMWAAGLLVDDLGHPVIPDKVVRGAYIVLVMVILPNMALMTLATLIATPFVVRRALAGLGEAAAQAGRIDIERRGTRLSQENVPSEVSPLVKAMNDALGRLDEGYERHQRFLIDAAHELRTPIAILQTRLESLPDSPEKTRLREDGARLSTLAEQLLDLQRLAQPSAHFTRIDLVAIARRVTVDLAPLAIAAGYEVSFEQQLEYVPVMGDEASIERALTNLVQNAIEHGGRRGTIVIGVLVAESTEAQRLGTVDVSDNGPGIPIEQRERIFEPFHRIRPRTRGAGLGLNLVQEIVRRHRGHIAVLDNSQGGARFRMTFPVVQGA